MLSLALIHGINGLRVISLDYIRRPGIRVAVNGFFAILGVAIFALGSIVVFTFDPSKWPGVG
jgi:succinate dehydrogenase / fumarate reductase membrane anchor subunit